MAELTPFEKYIIATIKEQNYCLTDNDCVDIPTGYCPFGCCIYLNKVHRPWVKDLIDRYMETLGQRPRCLYDCHPCPKGVCKNNICQRRRHRQTKDGMARWGF